MSEKKYEYRCKNCGHWYLFDEHPPDSQVCKKTIPLEVFPGAGDCDGELEFRGEVEVEA